MKNSRINPKNVSALTQCSENESTLSLILFVRETFYDVMLQGALLLILSRKMVVTIY